MLHEEVLTRINSTEITGVDTPHATRENCKAFTRPGEIGIGGLKGGGRSNIYKDVLALSLMAGPLISPEGSRLCGRDWLLLCPASSGLALTQSRLHGRDLCA